MARQNMKWLRSNAYWPSLNRVRLAPASSYLKPCLDILADRMGLRLLRLFARLAYLFPVFSTYLDSEHVAPSIL